MADNTIQKCRFSHPLRRTFCETEIPVDMTFKQIEEKLIEEVGDAATLMVDIEEVISRIDNVNYQTVLHKRYIACKKWETIGAEMHYEPRWAWELNERALIEVAKLIN